MSATNAAADQNASPKRRTGHRRREDEAGERAEAVTPAEVEDLCARSLAQQQGGPGNAAAEEVGQDHAAQCPVLQVRAEQEWIEPDLADGRQTSAELDVLDRRGWVPLGIEPSDAEERVATDGAETRPERRRRTCGLLVHVMVQEVAKARNGARRLGRVVVRAEDGDQARGLERAPDPLERVGVRQHVGVDEDENVTACAARTVVPRGGRPRELALIDDDDFLRRVVRLANRLQAPRERLWAIGGGDDGRQRRAAGHTGHRREAVGKPVGSDGLAWAVWLGS